MNGKSKQVTGWSGWVLFAGYLMMIAGIFQGIAGLVALLKHSVYLVTSSSLLVFSYTQWGWIHLILGVVLLLSGVSLVAGQMWGRVMGVLLASLSAIANFAFITSYPFWSILIIVIDVLIIYGITVHGKDLVE